MTTSVTVPVTMTPEAETRIAELGFQDQAGRMIEYAKQMVPGLVRIEVELAERFDMGGAAGVTVFAYSAGPADPALRTRRELGSWMLATFPPEVLEHLIISYVPGAGHAG